MRYTSDLKNSSAVEQWKQMHYRTHGMTAEEYRAEENRQKKQEMIDNFMLQ